MRDYYDFSKMKPKPNPYATRKKDYTNQATKNKKAMKEDELTDAGKKPKVGDLEKNEMEEKLEENVTQRLEKCKFKIPDDLLDHPIFTGAAGYVYCLTEKNAERFFDFFRRNPNES